MFSKTTRMIVPMGYTLQGGPPRAAAMEGAFAHEAAPGAAAMEGSPGRRPRSHGSCVLLAAAAGGEGGRDGRPAPGSQAACAGGLGSSAPPHPAVAGCTSPGSSGPSARRAAEGARPEVELEMEAWDLGAAVT
ncbi:hypothetical protein PVAP13_9NG269746 [Panicum virgatum]|uniref:Uncharacterized protein n=1 Tax=Panicum virgatum TaxID=38727 RepID=A0A8T0MNQ0_PANVG|nr:hypothetical protein PVAP13_9NG269746 [Panicum virgatum]